MYFVKTLYKNPKHVEVDAKVYFNIFMNPVLYLNLKFILKDQNL